jgi:hypothetical protein
VFFDNIYGPLHAYAYTELAASLCLSIRQPDHEIQQILEKAPTN